MSEPVTTSFLRERGKGTIAEQISILAEYKSKFEDALLLKGDFAIFIDTNFLLRFYTMSSEAQAKVLQLFGSDSTRIVISSQVEVEYLRNREGAIRTYENALTVKLQKEFKELLNQVNAFYNNNKKLLLTAPPIQNLMDAYVKNGNDIETALSDLSKKNKGLHHELLYYDELMNKVNQLVKAPPLTEEYVKNLKKELDILIKDNPGVSSKLIQPVLMFPGAGDIKEKDDPSGDFIIFHEMMDYALANNKDIIFLTNDIKKGDWMHVDGGPLINYIENFYRNTRHLLFVLDAELAMNKLYDVSTESVITANGDDNVRSDEFSKKPEVMFDEFNRRLVPSQYILNYLNDIFGYDISSFEAFKSARSYSQYLSIRNYLWSNLIELGYNEKYLDDLVSKLLDIIYSSNYGELQHKIMNTAWYL